MTGFGIIISIGKWGGIYIARGWMWRFALGFVAITFVPRDGDDIIELARIGSEAIKQDTAVLR